eukprot:jgi/Ulvmu1/2290/UM013_0137.1
MSSSLVHTDAGNGFIEAGCHSQHCCTQSQLDCAMESADSQCSPPTVQFIGLGTRLGTYLMCASYLILMIRHFRSPFSSFLHRLYRLADGSWLLNAVLLVCIFSVGLRKITAAEYITIAHIFALNAAIIAQGRMVGWSQEPAFPTSEYYLVQCGKELAMTGSYVARTVLAWWFWVSLYDDMLCSDAHRPVFAFFFARVEAFGWFRVLAIICLALAALQLPFVMAFMDENDTWMLQYRATIAIFIFCSVGAELTLHWNGVHGANSFRHDSTAEVLAILIGGKSLIWASLKPQRESDPLVLLVRDTAHRIPVSWPYAGLDLQGILDLLDRARLPGRMIRQALAV